MAPDFSEKAVGCHFLTCKPAWLEDLWESIDYLYLFVVSSFLVASLSKSTLGPQIYFGCFW